MASASVRASFRTRVEALFADISADWPYIETVNLAGHPDGVESYVTLEFPGGTERLRAFGSPGNNPWEELGVVAAHFFQRVGRAPAVMEGHAETLRNDLRNARFDGVRVTAVDPTDSGPGSDDGAWVRATVFVEYRKDTYA